MSELWAQMEYILTPNNTTTSTSTEGSKDSISRLMFKLMIVQAFETVCKQTEDQLIAGGDTGLTRIKAIRARIEKGKDELARRSTCWMRRVWSGGTCWKHSGQGATEEELCMSERCSTDVPNNQSVQKGLDDKSIVSLNGAEHAKAMGVPSIR